MNTEYFSSEEICKIVKIPFWLSVDSIPIIQNATIEERVALLEIQVVEIQDDVTGLDQDVNFLFDETVIQDERLFSLEEETEEIDEQLIVIDDNLESVYYKNGVYFLIINSDTINNIVL